MPKITIEAKIFAPQIYFLLSIILMMNLLMLGGTWLFSNHYYDDLAGNWGNASDSSYFLLQFNLATENVIATWYSSMLLLLAAIMGLFCFTLDQTRSLNLRDRYLSYGWIFFSGVFIVLSLDEVGSLHEEAGEIIALGFFGTYPSGWVFILSIPIVMVGISMLLFGWVHLRRVPLAFAFTIIGIGLFLSIPVQEYFEHKAWRAAPDYATWRRPVFYLLLEEGSEIFGSLCFILSSALYSISLSRKKEDLFSSSYFHIRFAIRRKMALLYFTLLALIAGIGMITIKFTIPNPVEGGDTGTPENWFPSAIAFFVSAFSFYIFRIAKENQPKSARNIYLALSVLCIVLSMYYGSGMYAYVLWGERIRFEIINALALALVVLFGIKLFLINKKPGYRFGIIAWAVFLCVAFSLGKSYSTGYAFIAFYFLFISLLFAIDQQQASLTAAPQKASPLVKG
jgi:hypothetical protein